MSEAANEPAIDPQAIEFLRRVGKRALVDRLIGMFLVSGPTRVRAMQEAAESGDMAALERAAHSLRSSAGQIGAMRLSRTCGRLEARAAAGEAEGTAEDARAAGEELEAAVNALTAMTIAGDFTS